jgi:hypothetical protein
VRCGTEAGEGGTTVHRPMSLLGIGRISIVRRGSLGDGEKGKAIFSRRKSSNWPVRGHFSRMPVGLSNGRRRFVRAHIVPVGSRYIHTWQAVASFLLLTNGMPLAVCSAGGMKENEDEMVVPGWGCLPPRLMGAERDLQGNPPRRTSPGWPN